MDLFDFADSNEIAEDKQAQEKSILTVSQLTRKIRNLIEYRVGAVWVEGEISNLRKQASGHQYFTLKDKGSQLSCVLFRGNATKLSVDLEDGQEIQLFGDVTVYEPRGNYQLIVRQAQLKGLGALQAKFEALKNKLNEEGLFDPKIKLPIPTFPNTICIITSPTGAAIKDILSVLKRRAPWVRVILYPVLVQGDSAAKEIAEAIQNIENWSQEGKIRIDTVLLTRGGGSIEDLWPFNEEKTARAINSLSLPVVSAVGHEIDYTISDFTADMRAPTPSAAAELLVPDAQEIRSQLQSINRSLSYRVSDTLDRWKERLDYLGTNTLINEPKRKIADLDQSIDLKMDSLKSALMDSLREKKDSMSNLGNRISICHPAKQLETVLGQFKILDNRLQNAAQSLINRSNERSEKAAVAIKALGPESVLDRGFSLTHGKDGKLITSTKNVNSGDKLETRVSDGTINTTVD
ncbi:MAG: exodeoxyribonuclease VII large subunit [Verrucomicrobiales bacterium]|jgi:exodeoxyribonuclease VII large subunit|nr:exodeoxyribonuclease VII large subunit [Verrucomicrobiales bacterium]